MKPDEPLHPDLVPYLRESSAGFGRVLHHPYVVSVIPLPEFVNKTYLYKREAVPEAAARGDWPQVLFLHERPYRLSLVVGWIEDAADGDETRTRDQLHDLLALAWTDCEGPSGLDDNPALVAAFRYVGYVSDNLKDPPTYRMVVYRGGPTPDALSWTRDPGKAAWFADRFGRAHPVWRAVAPPEAILATFLDRGEAEVVVDPDLLTDVEQFSREETDGLLRSRHV